MNPNPATVSISPSTASALKGPQSAPLHTVIAPVGTRNPNDPNRK